MNAAPSKPNLNLFKSSSSGVLLSLSNAVGPPIKSPKEPTSVTSSTNTPSAIPPKPAPDAKEVTFSPLVASCEKASSTKPISLFVSFSVLANFLDMALAVSPPKSKYLPLFLAISADLAKLLPALKAKPPGTARLVIISVSLPAVVASAISSNGFIFAKNFSTSAALLVSAPRSISVAPSDTKPSGILNKPEPKPASTETIVLVSLSCSASKSLVASPVESKPNFLLRSSVEN